MPITKALPSLSRVLSEPWLMYEPSMAAFLSTLETRVASLSIDPSDDSDYLHEDDEPKPYKIDDQGIAQLSFHGVVGKRLDWWEKYIGMMDLDDFNASLNMAAADDSVTSIRIDFDSPGGYVTGVLESMQNLRRVAGIKPVTAYTEMMMASAAYFIGSQATRIVATESAVVGSIGTMMTFIDRSKMLKEYGIEVDVIKNKEGTFKGAGSFGTSLTKAQRDQFQESLQILHDRSVGMIKEKRPGLSDDYMRGQAVRGYEAYWKGSGLIDDIASV